MNTSGSPNDVHTLSLVVRDRPGVLVRIALVFARRGYNIESLAVSPGAAGGFARMTITSRGKPETLEQIIKQLGKLVDVAHVTDHEEAVPLEAEIAFIKVSRSGPQEHELQALAQRFGATVVDVSDDTLVVRVQGTTAELETVLAELRPHGIQELVRSGSIVIDRGRSQLSHLLLQPDL